MQIQNEKEALEYLNSGKENPPLSRDEMLLLAGMRDDKLPYLTAHVAGTNGKGSACAFLHSILTHAGYKTGLFTSPHLIRFHERIRVGRKDISSSGLVRCVRTVLAREQKYGLKPPPFARFTALALEWFRIRKVDAAVFEVGLGGLLDPTNIIIPDVAVITAIGIDHIEKLGNTIEKIAMQKCGIIKHGATMISHPQKPEARRIINETCSKQNATLIDSTYSKVIPITSGLSGQSFSLETPQGAFRKLHTRLAGAHQLDNARTAVLAALALREKGADIPFAAIEKGIEKTQWPCRMQAVCRNPLIILDGAHNGDAAEALEAAVREMLAGVPITLVAGIIKGKDAGAIARHVGFAGFAIAVKPDADRGMEEEEFARYLELYVPRVCTADSPEEALKLALRRAKNTNGAIVVAGSLYLCGTMLQLFR